MKVLVDFLPIIAFFVVFKAVGGPSGVYAATATAIVTAILIALFTWLRTRQVERQQLIMLAILIVLGGLTLALHDERYIKWKPTVVSWVMGTGFLLSQWFGRKNFAERMFGANIEAPARVWRNINLAWVGFFVALGFLNLYFAFYWSTEAWVNFKVFGTLGLSVGFAVVQALFLMRYDVRDSAPDKD